MRVLWVKAGKLLPLNTGGKLRSFHLMRQLAAAHDLVPLSYYGGPIDPDYEAELRRNFPAAEPVATKLPEAEVAAYAARILHPAPYAVAKFTSPVVRSLVRARLDDGSFDVAVCDFLSASLNFPRRPATPCVLFQHNVETTLWRRQATHAPGLAARLAFTVEAWKMARYERHTVARFERVIAVSEADRAVMGTMTDPARISVVPTGVDVTAFRAIAHSAAKRPVVMFLGSMDWEPNVDAVEYFVHDVWPSVLRAVPDAAFWVVGRNPGPSMLALNSDSVRVTGTVPSVLEYLEQAAAVVVPLRVGGGTRLKILEAMAAGRAVVSTSIGAEGLDVMPDRDIVLADDRERMASDVIDLLRNPQRRASVGRAAAESAGRFDWASVATAMEDVLCRAATIRPRTARAARMVEADA